MWKQNLLQAAEYIICTFWWIFVVFSNQLFPPLLFILYAFHILIMWWSDCFVVVVGFHFVCYCIFCNITVTSPTKPQKSARGRLKWIGWNPRAQKIFRAHKMQPGAGGSIRPWVRGCKRQNIEDKNVPRTWYSNDDLMINKLGK